MIHFEVEVIRIEEFHGKYLLWVMCPFCEKEHSHGVTNIIGLTEFGGHLSNCYLQPRNRYRIILRKFPKESLNAVPV